MKSLSIILRNNIAKMISPKKALLLLFASQVCFSSPLRAGSTDLYSCRHGNHPVRKINKANPAATKKAGVPFTPAVKRPGVLSPPTLSYNTPQSFVVNTPIAPLAPTSSGVAPAGYSGVAVPFATGLGHPRGITTDAAGNIIISDFGTNIVKEYPAGGGATTTIGSGFSGPDGVAVDAQENFYISDYGHTAVKKVPAGGGAITTIGSGYNSPYGVAADAAGNAYVADYLNGAVRKIPANGGATVVVGGGFTSPAGVAVDAAGNIFVADYGASAVTEIRATGPTNSLGSGFSHPYGVAVDHLGNVFVADFGNQALKEIPVGGGATITIATGFTTLTGVTLDNAGIIYTADYDNTTVESFKPTGGYYVSPALPAGLQMDNSTGVISGNPTQQTAPATYTITAYNSSGSTSFQLNISVVALTISYASPQNYTKGTAISPLTPTSGMVAAAGYSTSPTVNNAIGSGPYSVKLDALNNIYVIDAGSFQVVEYPAGGGAPTSFGSGFTTPQDLAMDAAGNIYVADYGNNAIKKIPAGNGTPITLGSGFSGPTGVAVDAAGNVYVADTGNNLVKEIPVGGGAVITIGSGFNAPDALAVDAAGNVYVADRNNGAIKMIPAGNGTPVTLVSGLNGPYGVAVDYSGNVFYSDRNNSVVKELVGGTGSPVVIGSGFSFPYQLTTDAAGNVYVADFGNKAIKKIAPVGGFYISQSLPAGLSFSSATGAISGTPTAISPATNYTVTAYNSSGSNSATVSIRVSPSANANLSSLSISNGTLSPAFSAGALNYTANVNNGLASMTITPTAADPGATITVNGVAVTSGSMSQSLPLVVGANAINVVVTASDNVSTKTYTLTVTRAPSTNDNLSSLKISKGIFSPTFASATTSYTDAVGNTITSVTVTPTTAGANATVKVNGTAVASGAASGAINLNVGNNTISIVVTAQDGTTTKTYTVTVTRAGNNNDNLTSLKMSKGIFSPAFASTTTSYTDAVGNTITSVTVTPTTSDPDATVKVNGTTVASGAASGAINLAVGANTINVVVTASDNVTTKTYTITVTRAGNNNDNLTSLKMSKGIFSPTFASCTTSYTDAVGNTITSVTVTPTTSDPDATVKVNGTTVASGVASGAINLAVGANAINVVVTASDNVTTKAYTVTVTRAGNNNDNLASLKMSKGIFSPTFASTITSYTDAVGNTITSVAVTPTASDPDATIQVNGTTVASGTASGAINVPVGANTINVVVTASDMVTTKTYKVTVNRASGGADSFDPGISVTKPTETPTLAEDGIQVHQAISPNGDGLNDFFQIDNISQYPDNKLTIMNRNGQLIFEAKGYDNSSKAFDGHSNKNGQMQLPGTYFYQLDYVVNGITKHKTGFLVLKY